MARVLAISSQVASGHVGLSAMVPALQALGHEVVALPTVLLSNHPGHGISAGAPVPPDQLSQVLEALGARGELACVDAVITGYLPTPEHIGCAADAIAATRAARPDHPPLIVCDPVCGDWPKGAYLPADVVDGLRDTLLPLADALTPNVFEWALMTGDQTAETTADTLALSPAEIAGTASSLRARHIVVTGLGLPHGANTVETVWVDTAIGRTTSSRIARIAQVPNGTGDLLTALFAGYLLGPGEQAHALARATAGVAAVLAASEGKSELQLVAALPALTRAPDVAEPAQQNA
ncbi:MAG: pyridoxal kinase [Pseudomonadota bacterium]